MGQRSLLGRGTDECGVWQMRENRSLGGRLGFWVKVSGSQTCQQLESLEELPNPPLPGLTPHTVMSLVSVWPGLWTL